MTTVEELLRSPERLIHAGNLEADAFAEDDVLREAALRDFHYDWASGSAAFLLDLRVSFFRTANVAVVQLCEVASTSLSQAKIYPGRWLADLVMSSRSRRRGNLVSFEIGCLSGMLIEVVARQAEFFIGDIPGLPEAQPDFGECNQSEINEGMPAWGREFRLLGSSFMVGGGR